MSALARAQDTAGQTDDAWLDWLMAAVAQNQFMPAPEPENIFVGDGDFRAIGAEFLGHLIRIGGLRPDDRVLDIGSGIGRLALPLTQFMAPDAGYLGLDPARAGIAWCQKSISPVYPNFAFRHLDVAHPLYNPDGLLNGESLVLPVGDSSVDFTVMLSVVTHLPPREVVTYSRELARVLAPGGRCFVTCFAIDAGGPPRTVTDPRCTFQRIDEGPAWSASAGDPLGMVAYDDGWLEARFADAGFACDGLLEGSWRGIRSPHYQDILVARLAAAR